MATDYTALQPITLWNEPTHFSPPGTPAKGDSITVPAGRHLHVQGMQEIGKSAAMGAEPAITFQGPNCRLVWEANATLRYRGEINHAGGGANFNEWGRLVFRPGSKLIHDSTEATDPTNQHYGVRMGSADNTYCLCDFSESTDPNNRVEIYSEAGGGRGWFDTPNFLRVGGAWCPAGSGYVDHLRWGGRDATNYAYTSRFGYGQAGNQYRQMSFTDCGGIYMPSMWTGAEPVLEDIWFGETKTTECIFVENASAIDANGIMRRITCDKKIQINRSLDWEVYECIFGDRPSLLSGPAPVFEKVIVIKTTSQAWSTWGGKVSNCTVITHNDDGNPHFIQTIAEVPQNEIDGLVCIYTGTAKEDAGDGVLINGTGAHHTIINRLLVLDDKAHTTATSTLVSLLGGPGATVAIRKSTGISHGVNTGETFIGETGQITEMVDVLVANFSGANRWKLRDIYPTTPKMLNPVLPVNAHHNAGHNLAVGSNGKHYDGMSLAPDDGTIGANDVDADPQFAAMQYLEDFDAANGGQGTNDSAVENILQWNHPTNGNPGYSPVSLFDFFLSEASDNFKPTNPVFENAGSGGTGTTIGAKSWKSAGPPPPPAGEGGYDPFGPGVFE